MIENYAPHLFNVREQPEKPLRPSSLRARAAGAYRKRQARAEARTGRNVRRAYTVLYGRWYERLFVKVGAMLRWGRYD